MPADPNLPHKMDSEKSVYLDREEHWHRGSIGAKAVVPFYYDSGTDTLTPASQASGGGSSLAKATDAYGISAISTTATHKYFFFEDASGNWYVMRKNLTTSVFDYTKGTGGYSSVYVDATSAPSGSPTYAGYGTTF